MKTLNATEFETLVSMHQFDEYDRSFLANVLDNADLSKKQGRKLENIRKKAYTYKKSEELKAIDPHLAVFRDKEKLTEIEIIAEMFARSDDEIVNFARNFWNVRRNENESLPDLRKRCEIAIRAQFVKYWLKFENDLPWL